MADEAPDESLFRAKKRRRVIRNRRASDDTEDHQPAVIDPAITKHEYENTGVGSSGIMRAQKKSGIRKNGIGFSSVDGRRTNDKHSNEENQEVALVPAAELPEPEVAGNDRFVRPTGRVDVTEDKHMMAYVDSKLAEMRSAATIAADTVTSSSSACRDVDLEASQSNIGLKTSQDDLEPAASARNYHQAQARSSRVYHRPTKRRPRLEREQEDIARDSMIDQIMRENQVPHYDRSSTQNAAVVGEDADNDSAAADAFKAQLIADMEQTRRRPALSGKNTAAMVTGPKLGGSRSQREKMKALEEAKTGGGGKK